MSEGAMIPARSLLDLLARIFGPAVYDAPPWSGDVFGPFPDPWRHSHIAALGRRGLLDMVTGPVPDPWLEVALNPQPLPPKERYAVALASAHIREIALADRLGTLFGGEVEERALDRVLTRVSEIDDLCPRWPRWPKGGPVPPRPPWGDEEMEPAQLLLFGVGLLAAADGLDNANLQTRVTELGEKMLAFVQG